MKQKNNSLPNWPKEEDNLKERKYLQTKEKQSFKKKTKLTSSNFKFIERTEIVRKQNQPVWVAQCKKRKNAYGLFQIKITHMLSNCFKSNFF